MIPFIIFAIVVVIATIALLATTNKKDEFQVAMDEVKTPTPVRKVEPSLSSIPETAIIEKTVEPEVEETKEEPVSEPA